MKYFLILITSTSLFAFEGRGLFFKFGGGVVLDSEIQNVSFGAPADIDLSETVLPLGYAITLGLGKEFKTNSKLSFSLGLNGLYTSSSDTDTSLEGSTTTLKSFKMKQTSLEATAEASAYLNFRLKRFILGPLLSIESGYTMRQDIIRYQKDTSSQLDYDRTTDVMMIPMKVSLGFRIINTDGFFSFLKASYSNLKPNSEETTVYDIVNDKDVITDTKNYETDSSLSLLLGGGYYF